MLDVLIALILIGLIRARLTLGLKRAATEATGDRPLKIETVMIVILVILSLNSIITVAVNSAAIGY